MSDVGGTNGAGWQPDPDGRHEYRYWDGTAWSDQVSDAGVVSTDPRGPAPTAVVPPTTVDQPIVFTPVESAAPPGAQPGAAYPGVPPAQKSGLPIGVLALVGLVVAALVVGGVLFVTGGDDGGGSSDEVSASTDDVTDDVSDEVTDDVTDDASSDFSDDFSDDFTDDVTDDFTDELTDDTGGVVSANDLEIGDCVVDEATLNSSNVSPIDCGQPHVFELFGTYDVPGNDFPGDAALTSQGNDICHGGLFTNYVGVTYTNAPVTYASPVSPSEETWTNANDRTILCFAHNQDLTPTTGSVEGTRQ